jgi:hypothetical protein
MMAIAMSVIKGIFHTKNDAILFSLQFSNPKHDRTNHCRETRQYDPVKDCFHISPEKEKFKKIPP